MRKPTRSAVPQKQQDAVTTSVASPTGGWNARDPLANMNPLDAVYLQNIIPRTGFCETRKGSSNHLIDIVGAVQSLLVYNKDNGLSKLFACTNSGIFDATNPGTVGASLLTLTNGRLQYNQISTSGGQFLTAVNGIDKLVLYDGTTFSFIDGTSTPAITGVDTTTLIHVHNFKRRQFFVEKDSLSLWYLPLDSVAGAAVEFPLGAFFTRGGYIVACETWTIDAGEGIDDHLVIFTSEGEVAIYKGTDPSSASTWAARGLYYIGAALGYRSMTKVGGDVLLLTQTGAFPLSKGLQSATVNAKLAITDKIQQAYINASTLYKNNFGWEAIVYPEEALLILNIPTINLASSEQYVMNTVTGAWCSFTNWNAICFALVNGVLYYGTQGRVVKAYVGESDNGAVIPVDGKSAYNYFNSPGQNKQWTLCRLILQSTGSVATQLALEVDFEQDFLFAGPTITPPNVTLWDVGIWDDALWGGSEVFSKDWSSPSGKVGYCASTRIKINSTTTQVKWIATDYVYKKGGVL